MIRLLTRAANWIADRSIADHGLGYCGFLEDGFPCGRPAMAEGTTAEGDDIAVCPMHDWILV